MLDTGYWILDAGQIMDELIPISRLEGGVVIGDPRSSILDADEQRHNIICFNHEGHKGHEVYFK